jgi:hypothetical protein
MVDAGADVAVTARLLREPTPPPNQRCTRDVQCVPQLASPPTYPFPHPFERCDPNPLGETGHLSARETTQRRADDPDVCCYVSFDQCQGRRATVRPVLGRPLRDVFGAFILAQTVRRAAWSQDVIARPDAVREAWWSACGAAEHASIAEFARLTLVLLALGAPSDLVRDAQRAAIDEIDHARVCFTLASRYAGHAVGPGVLAVARGTLDSSLRALAENTLRDGCYGETAGALVLRSVARESDPETAPIVDRMADDEERHANLAWRILRFCMEMDPRSTVEVTRKFLSTLGDDALAEEVVVPCASQLISAFERTTHASDCVLGGWVRSHS